MSHMYSQSLNIVFYATSVNEDKITIWWFVVQPSNTNENNV